MIKTEKTTDKETNPLSKVADEAVEAWFRAYESTPDDLEYNRAERDQVMRRLMCDVATYYYCVELSDIEPEDLMRFEISFLSHWWRMHHDAERRDEVAAVRAMAEFAERNAEWRYGVRPRQVAS